MDFTPDYSPYAVYNIGNSNPENLLDFVTILQEELIRAEVLPAEYYGAAEPPVRCGESHLSGLTEPPQFVY